MNRRILIIFMISIVVFTSFTVVWANTENDLTKELTENLIPLKTTLAENGLEDLMPLKEILKDKKIVAMGEATHGTAEFFQMKHRMFEFLVKEMNYRVFGIEANFGSSKIINDYILGEGSVDKCLKALEFWTWDTKEVMDMLIWMKEYNKDAKQNDKIRFYGFDMQSMDKSLIYILDYLYKIGSPSITEYNIRLKSSNDTIIPVNRGKTMEFSKNIDKIHNEIIENKEKYIAKSSIEEYDLVEQNIVVVYQYLDFLKDSSFDNRDYYMAENVNWILDYESKYYGNDKIMLWAHNGHVTNKSTFQTVMGNNLKSYHGDDYYSIGFDFYQGSFIALPSISASLSSGGLAKFHIDSTPDGSFAHEMMRTQQPISFLDFNKVKENIILSDFLSKKIHVNSIGATYWGKQHNIMPYNKIILKDAFDGIIFIKSTTAATRARTESELPDGNKTIVFTYIFNIILVISGFTTIIIATIRMVKRPRYNGEDKYNILNKNNEDSINNKGLKGLIVKINNYFNSISTIKYSAFIVSSTMVLGLISIKLNSLDSYSYQMVLYNSTIIITRTLLFFTIIGLAQIYLTFILPFIIVKSLFGSKSTNLNLIIITAIIGAIINTLGYRYSGIGLYSLNIFMNFILGALNCYSYDLFYYRGEKPIVNFIIIMFFYNILMILFAFVTTLR